MTIVGWELTAIDQVKKNQSTRDGVSGTISWLLTDCQLRCQSSVDWNVDRVLV